MKNYKDTLSDNLIMSRLQQIELANLKSSTSIDSPYAVLLNHISLQPFFDHLPLHIGLKLQLIGTTILGAVVKRGFMFQDLEQRLSHSTLSENLVAIERLQLAYPIFYQTALLKAASVFNAQPLSEEFQHQLHVAMEVARIHHHFEVIKNICYCLRLDHLAELAATAISSQKNAFSRCYRLGKTAEPLSANNFNNLINDGLMLTEELFANLSDETSVKDALFKKANISLMMAGSYGLTGAYLRSNHTYHDVRSHYPSPPEIMVNEGGDAYARFSLRILEIMASFSWIKRFHKGPLEPVVINPISSTFTGEKPFAYGEVEGPEGLVKVSIFRDSDEKLLYRIRTPAYFITQAIPHMLLRHELKDIAILLFSLGITAEELDK